MFTLSWIHSFSTQSIWQVWNVLLCGSLLFLSRSRVFISINKSSLCFCYNWQLQNVPSHCVCGTSYSINHCMICCHGGLTSVRHSKLCDLIATWQWEACHDVLIDPLHPLSSEVFIPATANRCDDARTVIHARGFWGRWQSAFFDVRVFHINAPPYLYFFLVSKT